MAFYSIEPFGEERADLRFAILQANYFNSKRDPKKGGPRLEPRSFMPKFDGSRSGDDRGRRSSVADQVRETFGQMAGRKFDGKPRKRRS